MSNPPSKDPVLRGLIESEHNRAVRRASIYADNAEGVRAGFILPDGDKASFSPDPDGVNINGGKVARLIYQARMTAGPSAFGASRVGVWLSTIWTPPAETPTAKAVFYGYYLTAKGFHGEIGLPQSNSVLVVKGETATGQAHGKTEAAVFAAAHQRTPATTPEDAHGLLTEAGEVLTGETTDSLLEEADGTAYLFTNGKLVCTQNVLVFDGPDIGWNHDPETDDDDGDGSLDGDDDEVSTPRLAYPGYGTAWNNAGLTSGFAAGIAKARKPDAGGTPWTHGFYVSKRGVSCFSFRHQKYFGVCMIGFDPRDGIGPRAMPYLGIGIDAAQAPLHIKGPISIEARREYTGDGSAPYTLAEDAYLGRTSVGTTAVKMAAIRTDVTDPTRNLEYAQIALATRSRGVNADVLHVGRGLWTDGVTGGDQGPGTLNLSGLFIDGELIAGIDPDAADEVIPGTVFQTHKGMVIKATGPADTKFRGAVLYRHAATDDPASADELEFQSARPNRKIKFTDPDALVSGTTYFYYIASYSKLDVESTVRTLIGSAVYRNIQGADFEDGAVDLGATAVQGNLQQGQSLLLSSGISTPVAAKVLRFQVSDGDVLTYPDCGTLPDVDFLLGNLPTLASGSQYVGLATGLSSTGFTVSLQTITAPGAITAETTATGASDATVPRPGGAPVGFSVAKGSSTVSYNSQWRMRLNLTFTPVHSYDTLHATVRLWRFDGATWTKITDLDFAPDTTGTWTGNVTINFTADLSAMLSTDLFGVNIVSVYGGFNGGAVVINSFGPMSWKSQAAPGSTTSATPNGEQITCFVTLPS